MGFILFLLNIFLGVSFYVHGFNDQLQDKLGMYFYIKDDPTTQSITYKKVIALQDELAKQDIKTTFSSKEDALTFLEQKIPDIMSNFDRFGVQNPLPSTLYVMFHNQAQYDALKATLANYKDIILNTKDADSGIQQQEARTLSLINLMNFVEILMIVVAFVLVAVVLAILAMLTMFFTKYFHKHLEIRHILGWLIKETAKEFSVINLDILAIAFIVCGILVLFGWWLLGISLYEWLNVSFGSFVTQPTGLWVLISIVVEIVVFAAFSYGFSYFYLQHHLKKVS